MIGQPELTCSPLENFFEIQRETNKVTAEK